MDIFSKTSSKAVIVRIYKRTYNPKTRVYENRRVIHLEPCWKKTEKPNFLGRLFSLKTEPAKVEYISVKTKKIITVPATGYILEESPCHTGSCFIYPGGKRLVYQDRSFGPYQKGRFIPCEENCLDSADKTEKKIYAVIF